MGGDPGARSETSTELTLTMNSISGMTVVALRRELRKRGLPVAGRKAELRSRLQSALCPDVPVESAPDEDRRDLDQEAQECQDLEPERNTGQIQHSLDPQVREDQKDQGTKTRHNKNPATRLAVPNGTNDKSRSTENITTHHADDQNRKRSRDESELVSESPAARPSLTSIESHDSKRSRWEAAPVILEKSRGTPKRMPLSLLEQLVESGTACVVSCRNDKKLYGVLRAYDKHFNLVLEHVRELWQDRGAVSGSMMAGVHERYIPKLFVRGDTVVFVLRLTV